MPSLSDRIVKARNTLRLRFERAKRTRAQRNEIKRIVRQHRREHRQPVDTFRAISDVGESAVNTLAEYINFVENWHIVCSTIAVLLTPIVCVGVVWDRGYIGAYLLLAAIIWGSVIITRPRSYARVLAAADDPRMLGRLIGMVFGGLRATRNASAQALTSMLPGISRADAMAIPQERREWIYRYIQPRRNLAHDQLILATLAMLENTNDYWAYPAVRNVARRKGVGTGNRIVRAAARKCADALRDGYEEAVKEAKLLRPASEPGASDETLLRPAAVGAETPDELLLHAIDNNDER